MVDDILDQLPHWLAVAVVVVAVPLVWYMALLLWRIVNVDPEGAALRAVAVFSTCVALLVTVFAGVFVNNGMAEPVLTPRDTMLITRSALLVLSVVPVVYWLRWYRSNGNGGR